MTDPKIYTREEVECQATEQAIEWWNEFIEQDDPYREGEQ